MRRIAATCLVSLLLYAAAFALVLDRPLALGFLRAQIEAKLARGMAIRAPKLVILAGSNGPYSHRCEVIEPILGMPCVNAGVAVGVGLDYLFARWEPLLHPGDRVYMPLEEAQYTRSRATNAVGPDAVIMLRHEWPVLAVLGADRWLGALFASDLRGAVASIVEMSLVAGQFRDPRAEATGTTNEWGDHVGHTPARGAANVPLLVVAVPHHASAEQIRAGDRSALVLGFVAWAGRHGVHVTGGLPTGFADAPIPEATIAAIRTIYLTAGASFLELPSRSLYPRTAFFDTVEHLNEPAQILHSRAIATALRGNRDCQKRPGISKRD